MAGKLANDYAHLFTQLEPSGAAWGSAPSHAQLIDPVSVDAVIDYRYALYQSFGDSMSRASSRMDQLLDEALPATTDEMLEDWASVLGISFVNDVDISVKRNAIIAKLLSTGDQSRGFYESYSLQYGYQLNLVKYGPRLYGQNENYGKNYGAPAWRFFWLFEMGGAYKYDPIYEQEIINLSPAHIRVRFDYKDAQTQAFYNDIAANFNLTVHFDPLDGHRFNGRFGRRFGGREWRRVWLFEVDSVHRNEIFEQIVKDHVPLGTISIFKYREE